MRKVAFDPLLVPQARSHRWSSYLSVWNMLTDVFVYWHNSSRWILATLVTEKNNRIISVGSRSPVFWLLESAVYQRCHKITYHICTKKLSVRGCEYCAHNWMEILYLFFLTRTFTVNLLIYFMRRKLKSPHEINEACQVWEQNRPP